MSRTTNFSIVASFLGLWINSFFGQQTQIIIGFLLIFTFGILHGANDILLINQTLSRNSGHSFYKILAYYVIIVVLGALLFYYLPALALFLFIVVSGYHFGEQHWQNHVLDKNKVLNVLFHLTYGLLILSLLFVFHVNEVQKIITAISKMNVAPGIIDMFFYISLSSFLILTIIKFLRNKEFIKTVFQELLFLFVFAIIFKTSSLIWGFAIYFILWHSIPSMFDQITFLYGAISLVNFKKYFKAAFYYWIVSLVGILILFFVFQKDYFFDALFFSFLAAITFPHVWVIITMFKHKQITSTSVLL